jgi:hypothetical protein
LYLSRLFIKTTVVQMEIVISESQFSKLLSEELRNDDYFELGLEYVKKWVRENNIELPRPKVPVSWILDNYGSEINQSLGLETWRGSNLSRFGMEALRQGLVENPSMVREGSFTEKYSAITKKILRSFLPDEFGEIEIIENPNWHVTIIINYNQEELLKKEGRLNYLQNLKRELLQKLKSLLSLKIGNRDYGNIDLSIEFKPESDWVTDVAPKLIKQLKKDMPFPIKRVTKGSGALGVTLNIFIPYNFRHKTRNHGVISVDEQIKDWFLNKGYKKPGSMIDIRTSY